MTEIAPNTLPILLALTLGVVGTLCLAGFAWVRRHMPGIPPFIVLTIACALWIMGNLGELMAPDLTTKMLWVRLMFVGIATAPVGWFMLGLHFSRRFSSSERKALVFCVTLSSLEIFTVFTNDFHHLFWTDLYIYELEGFRFVGVDHGPLFWMFSLYLYTLLIIGTIFILSYSFRVRDIYARQRMLMIIAMALPWTLNILYLTGIGPVLDLTGLGFSISCAILAYSLLRQRLLDVTPLAPSVIVDTFPDAVLVFDSKNRIYMANNAAAELLEYDRKAMIGAEAHTILPPELKGINSTSEENNQNRIYEFKGGHYEARKEPFYINNNDLIAQIIILRDVTTRIQYEQERTQSGIMFRELAEHMPIMVFEVDSNYIIRYLNQATLKRFGYSPEEVFGKKPLPEMIDPREIEKLEKRLTISGAPKDALSEEFTAITATGETFTVVSTGVELFDGDRFDGYRGYAIDISEQNKAREALEEAVQHTEAASQAKSAFIANVSHEIRTPLNGILGKAQVLLMDDLKPEQEGQANQILESGRSLLNILNDVLDLSKIEAGHLELENRPFDLAELLFYIKEMFNLSAKEKNITLTVHVPDESKPLLGDEFRIRQILTNLIGNAVKFTHKGEIIVTVNIEDQTNTPILKMTVADTGIGMSRQQLDDVFEAFAQADVTITRKFGGTGLGLTITKQLVELMNGTLDVESKINTGTQFLISIPVQWTTDDTPITHNDDTPQSELPDLGGKKVLLVEDNAVNMEIAISFFEYYGLKHEQAVNGREAIEMAAQNQYDMICMDIHMPEVNGIDASKAIIASNPENHPPIIAMTASVLTEEQDECFAVGMVDILPKPMSLELVDRIVRKHLA